MWNNKYLVQLILIFSTLSFTLAQTQKWTLEWDPNPENDILRYEVYRGTSPSPTGKLADVDHPTTTYEDNDIEKGVLYYYRLKAVNTAYQASEFSDQISAAIPKITNFPSSVQLDAGSELTFNLDDYVDDPDHADDLLTWQASGNTDLQVQINQSTRVLTITAPTGWDGSEIIDLSATDPDGFFDTFSMQVHAGNVISTSPPEIVSLNQIEFAEDGTRQIDLNDHVNDNDTPKSNLFWYTGSSAKVQVVINHNTNIAVFTAEENWNGTEKIWFFVKDPEENKDSVEVTVVVTAVNDAPVFSALPSINLSSTTSATLDLSKYVTDVDHDVSLMTWAYSGNQNVNVDISPQGIASFNVDQSWQGNEKFDLFVQDPAGAQDTAGITIYRQNQAEAPVISGLDDVTLLEDTELQIELNDYVSDPNDNKNELNWTVYENDYLTATLDNSAKSLKIKPIANWNGSTSLVLKVEDPGGNMDYDTLGIVVQPVNDAPQIRSIDNIVISASVFQTLELTDYIIEPDGLEDLVSIELIGPNSGFIGHYLDLQSYQITFFAPNGYEGQETFLLRIKDSYALEAATAFAVEVVSKSLDGGVDVAYFGGQTSLQLNWKTINPTRDYIEYGLTTNYDHQTPREDEYSTQHAQVLTNLEANKTYHFRVVSENENGRLLFSADSVFITGEPSEEVNVFPIPYRATDPLHKDGIVFSNLKRGSRITVYNVLGEVVYKTEKMDNILFRWDVKNNAGRDIHSGLYMFVILDNQKARYASGKIIVVR